MRKVKAAHVRCLASGEVCPARWEKRARNTEASIDLVGKILTGARPRQASGESTLHPGPSPACG